MSIKAQRGLGIFDFNANIKLGDLLLFIENVNIKKELFHTKMVDLVLIVTNDQIIFSRYVSLLYNYLRPESIFMFKSLRELQIHMIRTNKKYKFHYPLVEEYAPNKHPFDSTRIAQEFFRHNKFLPTLSTLPEVAKQAEKFLQEQCRNLIPISVHLKNKHKQKSNAQMQVWHHFFKYCHEHQYPFKFILIGDDLIPSEIKSIPNILLTKKYGFTIVEDLALIEVTKAYCGMCSGPFQIALFNKKPYLVFKNPDHHAREMVREIGDNILYPFAQENQIIIREPETFDKLILWFNHITKSFGKKNGT